MPAETLQTEGFALLKQPPGDNFQTYSVFSPAHGQLLVLQRVTRRANPAQAPIDLFDEVSLLLETSNQGRTYFVREARLITRHTDIARRYDALRFASALAGLVARNPVHEESRRGVGNLLRTALAAFAASDRPDVVYLKSVYRFARDEGYPLKEEWFPTLPSSDRAELSTLLNRPLSDQSAAPELVARYQRRLEEYLKGHTEIYVDGPERGRL